MEVMRWVNSVEVSMQIVDFYDAYKSEAAKSLVLSLKVTLDLKYAV